MPPFFDFGVGVMRSIGELEGADSKTLDERRLALQKQQAAMREGRPIPAIERPPGASIPISPDWTQEPTRNAERNSGSDRVIIGNSAGSQDLTQDPKSGSKEEKSGGLRPEASRGSESGETASLEMALPEYVEFAAEKNREKLQDAVDWRGPAWHFTRYMKSHPSLAGLSSQDACDVLDEVLEGLFPDAEDPWDALLGGMDSLHQECSSFEHFAHCWDLVQFELGEAPLEQAIRLADTNPVAMRGYRSKRWESYRRFISICRWLQLTQDEESFFVPVRKFGEILGVAITTVSNYRDRAVRDGYLVKVKDHEGRSKATEFRFNSSALELGDPAATPTDEVWGEIE